VFPGIPLHSVDDPTFPGIPLHVLPPESPTAAKRRLISPPRKVRTVSFQQRNHDYRIVLFSSVTVIRNRRVPKNRRGVSSNRRTTTRVKLANEEDRKI
jgi:hypothetical protein